MLRITGGTYVQRLGELSGGAVMTKVEASKRTFTDGNGRTYFILTKQVAGMHEIALDFTDWMTSNRVKPEQLEAHLEKLCGQI